MSKHRFALAPFSSARPASTQIDRSRPLGALRAGAQTVVNVPALMILGLAIPASGLAAPLTVPAGTQVFCELDERVSSKKDEQPVIGTKVKAHVWRDVVVDGHVVIEEGTPLELQIGDVRKAKALGQPGLMRLDAITVQAADGRTVALRGGYDRSGRGRKGEVLGVGIAIAWPLLFIQGEQAILEPGVIFDAELAGDTPIQREALARSVAFGPEHDLDVTILYDRIDIQ